MSNPENNEQYLSQAFAALRAAGFRTAEEEKDIQHAFIAAREKLRTLLGIQYDAKVKDYKDILQDVMHKFKLSPLLACSHCVQQFDREENKHVDPDGMGRALFMAAAFDIIEPELRRN